MKALVKYLLVILVVVGVITTETGCGKKKSPLPQRSVKKVHYDKNTGRYYYVVREKSNDGGDSWYYYWLMDGNSSTATQYYQTPRFSPLTRSTLAGTSRGKGNPPSAFAERPPTASELNNRTEPTEEVEVEQSETQENLGIPDENSLDFIRLFT
jgi:hypothetical protein